MPGIGLGVATPFSPVLIPGVARPFDPTQIAGLAFWLDASDASTILQTANAVSQWNDKSGNAVNFVQALGAKQPLYVPASKLIRFTRASGSVLSNPSLLNFQAFTLFSVHKYNAATIFSNTIVSQNGESSHGWELRGSDLAPPQFVVHTAGSNPNGSFNANATVGQTYLTVGKLDPVAQTRSAWDNGTVKLALTADTPPIAYAATPTANDVLAVGGNSGGVSGNLDADIQEIVVYSRALSSVEINEVANYLAVKDGTTWASIP